jgi:hypothetical protein
MYENGPEGDITVRRIYGRNTAETVIHTDLSSAEVTRASERFPAPLSQWLSRHDLIIQIFHIANA